MYFKMTKSFFIRTIAIFIVLGTSTVHSADLFYPFDEQKFVTLNELYGDIKEILTKREENYKKNRAKIYTRNRVVGAKFSKNIALKGEADLSAFEKNFEEWGESLEKNYEEMRQYYFVKGCGKHLIPAEAKLYITAQNEILKKEQIESKNLIEALDNYFCDHIPDFKENIEHVTYHYLLDEQLKREQYLRNMSYCGPK